MKLSNPKISSKTYWSILKTFYNGRKNTNIPSLLKDGKLASDFKIKANYFNNYFASQCTPLASFYRSTFIVGGGKQKGVSQNIVIGRIV